MKKYLLIHALIVVPFLCFSQIVPSHIPTNGLIAWYPFNSNANDESGNGNNGIVNGAVLTTDRNMAANSAYSFDGTDDYINCGNITAMNGVQQLTISAWINATSNVNYSRIIGKEQDSNNTEGFDLQFSANSGNTLATNVRTTGSSAGLSNTGITFGQWYHVAVVFDGTGTLNNDRFKMYINGVADTLSYIGTIPTTTSTNNFECWIGGIYPSPTMSPWNGKLDDIAIWNRALTPCEVKQVYMSGNSGLTLSASMLSYCLSDAQGALIGSPTGGTWSGPGVTGNSFDPAIADTGMHFVTYTYTDSTGCTTSDSVQLTVNLCTSLNSSVSQGSLSMFPNPVLATEEILIVCPNGTTRISVYDITGREIMTNEITDSNREFKLQIFEAGTYFIRTESNSGDIIVQQFVVQ